MLAFLAKRWFLLLLLTGLGLAWAQPCLLGGLVHPFDPHWVVAGALGLMAMSLDSQALLGALRRPWPALWAVAISYGLLPLLACAAGWLTPHPDLRLGLLLIASVPCTLSSAVLWTRMAGGNDAVALLVILLTTVSSWLITTAWLAFGAGVAVSIDAWSLMRSLVVVLVVPVGVGQAGRGLAVVRRLVTEQRNLLGAVAQLFILIVILQAAVEVSIELQENQTSIGSASLLASLALCLTTHAMALAAGYWSSRLGGFAWEERVAIAFAGSQKTLPVALFLFHAYFKDQYPLAVVPLAFYHVGQLVVDTFVADWLHGSRTTYAVPPPAAINGSLS